MKKQLLIVTDLGSFKAYVVEKSGLNTTARLELIEHYIPEEPHRKFAQKLSDLAGRYRAPGSLGGAPRGERHHLELEERKRLVRQFAKRLDALMGDGAMDSCHFAASKEIHHQILDALSPAARAKIRKHLPADLIKASNEKVLDYFGLRPERPVPATRFPNGGLRQVRPAL